MAHGHYPHVKPLRVVRKNSIGDGVSSVVCASGLWYGPRAGQGRAEEGSGKGERRVGRDVEHNNVERER